MLCPICQSDNPPQSQSCSTCGVVLAIPADENDRKHPDILPDGTLLAGTYLVESVLGQGGFGITYRCHDRMLDRRVAVKEFFPSGCGRQGTKVLPGRSLSDADFRDARAQFLAEARVLARCHHRSIVSVHTAFEANETAYMVMELLHGQSLAQLLEARGGRLPEEEAVSYIEQTGEALQFVHDLALLHRDIKPENIIACDDGRVMLIDFGTAREYSKGQAQGHTIVVTPGYAPLEQYARHAQRGAFTDVYGLAATLYHLLTGHIPPAASDRAMGVLLRPVREENPQISRSVARAVEAGLQIEIAKRPQSVREFLDLMKAPVEVSDFDAPIQARVGDESAILEPPSLGRLVALLPEEHTSNRQLLELYLATFSQPLQRAPQPVQLAPQRVLPIVTASSAPTPVSPSVMSGGIEFKNSSGPDSSINSQWVVFIIGLALIGCAMAMRWESDRQNSPSPSYTTSQSSPIVSSPPTGFTPGNPPREAIEDYSYVIPPTSMQVLPSSGGMARRDDSPAAYDVMKDKATFSPDGKLLAYLDSKAVVRVWNMEQRRVAQSFPQDKEHPVVSILFSRDGKTLVLTYQGRGRLRTHNRIRSWNLRTGKLQAELVLDPEKEWLWLQAELSNGQFIVRKKPLVDAQNPMPSSSILLWNAQNGKQTSMPVPIRNNKELIRIVVSPDGQEIVTGDVTGRIHWLDARTGGQKAEHITRMTYLDFQNTPFYAQNVPFGVNLSDPLPVEALRYSNNGYWLASRNMSEIRVFYSKGQEISTLPIGHSPLFALSSDGKFLVEGGGSKLPQEANVWDVTQNQKTRLATPGGSINNLTFSQDGKQIWGVSNDRGIIKLTTWLSTTRPVRVFKKSTESTFRASGPARSNDVDFVVKSWSRAKPN